MVSKDIFRKSGDKTDLQILSPNIFWYSGSGIFENNLLDFFNRNPNCCDFWGEIFPRIKKVVHNPCNYTIISYRKTRQPPVEKLEFRKLAVFPPSEFLEWWTIISGQIVTVEQIPSNWSTSADFKWNKNIKKMLSWEFSSKISDFNPKLGWILGCKCSEMKEAGGGVKWLGSTRLATV